MHELWAIKTTDAIMNWDGNKPNDYFIGLYERQNPERYFNKPRHEAFDNLHDIELALQDLYSTCAQNAWTKEKLLTSLENIINSSTTNNKAKSAEKYLATKSEEAKKIKESVENDLFKI
jgi:L-lactate utilization protein LutB